MYSNLFNQTLVPAYNPLLLSHVWKHLTALLYIEGFTKEELMTELSQTEIDYLDYEFDEGARAIDDNEEG